MAMSGTLFSLNLLNAPIGLVLAGLVGVAFGYFLEVAGLGSSRRLTAVFYFRDMAAAKVMVTAVVTAMVGHGLLVGWGWLNPEDVHGLETYWTAQIVGGLILGAGIVIGGWCPGTAIIGAVSAKLDALVFLGGAILGSIVFNEAFDLIEPIHDGYGAGLVFVHESLGLQRPAVVLLCCLLAVGSLAGMTRLETRFAGKSAPDALTRKRRRAAAALLLGAALLGLVTPGSEPAETPAPGPAGDVLAAVSRTDDHITPLALAEAMMTGRSGLIVVDLRPAGDFNRFHLKGAINIPLETLMCRAGAELPRNRPIVLMSNGTTSAAQAWSALRPAGWTNVKILTDGILGFWRCCLTPPSLAGVTDAAAAQAAQDDFAARRAFFLKGWPDGLRPMR
jgi:thiosulfate/3-mercaptopyruvate sulfurtransferase